MERWEEKFCVLTNVGLLYYANPLQPPQDLFPVVDCEIIKVKRGDADFSEGYEAVRFVYALRHITFRCQSKTDYDSWYSFIIQLQRHSGEKRKEMKINEENRLTTIAKGLGMIKNKLSN